VNKIIIISLCIFASLLFSSCFKEEPLNQECDIRKASVHLANPLATFSHASDTVAGITNDYASSDITFNNVLQYADLSALAPTFDLTPGAVITPASGTVRDFSKGPQEYVVVSEDKAWNRTYRVGFSTVEHIYDYNFENYYLSENGKYYIWSDLSKDKAPNWSTANAGFSIARSSASPEAYPTVPDADGFDGACVKLTTLSTGMWGAATNKRIAAGNIFLGSFDLSKALTKTLQSTLFGLPTAKKPLRFTGYYKYKPGLQMQDRMGNNIEGTDEAAIYALVYKNHDMAGNAVVLNGENIMTSPNRIGMARLYDIKHNEDWTAFDVAFDYWENIDADILKHSGYNLVVLCSSSKDGDMYQGAIGSTLWIDKLAIVVEE